MLKRDISLSIMLLLDYGTKRHMIQSYSSEIVVHLYYTVETQYTEI